MQNVVCSGDNRSFFYYKGDYYINGTEIVLADDYIDTHKWNGDKLWKYARYDHQVVHNGRIEYFFCISKCDWSFVRSLGMHPSVINEYAPYFLINALDLDSAIETMTKPIKLHRDQTEAILKAIVTPKRDIDNPSLMALWAVYILVLIGSLVFNQFYIIWLLTTIVFNKIRKEMLRG